MGIYEKLLIIQSKLKVGKNQRNTFGGYNYRSCEDIFEGVKPVLAEVGVALVVSDEIVEIGGRIYVKATALLYDIGGSGMVSNTAFAREAEAKKGMDESQVTGAASSYARKYALNGLFCLDDVKDADATNTHGKEAAAPKRPTARKLSGEDRKQKVQTVETIFDRYAANDFRGQLLKYLGITGLDGAPDAVIETAYSKALAYDRKKQSEAVGGEGNA